MKKLIILIFILISFSFSKQIRMYWEQLAPVNNKNEVWNIETFGYIENYNVKNATLKTSAINIKWNVRKGRIMVRSQGIDTEDEYIIRLFDKDTLRIDYVVIGLHSGKLYADTEYVIPKELVKDVKFVEIMNFTKKENWVPSYEIECKEGYSVQKSDDYYNAEDDLGKYILGVFESKCVKTPKEDYEVENINIDYNEQVQYHSLLDEAREKERLNQERYNNEHYYDDNKPIQQMELKSLGKNCWGDPNGSWFCE